MKTQKDTKCKKFDIKENDQITLKVIYIMIFIQNNEGFL